MKTIVTGLASASLLAVLPVSASAAPDIVAFTRHVDEISVFLMTGELCKTAGYTIASDALEKTVAPTMDQAVKDGIPESTAYGMMETAMETARESEMAPVRGYMAEAEAASKVKDDKAVIAALEGYFNHIDAKCQSYLQSPEFGGLITAPTGNARERFIDAMTKD